MEFEDKRPTSDEDRRLAEAKKLTLQPIHGDITPDTPQDSEIAARHIIEPPIGNVTNDIEESTSQVIPTQSLLDTRQPTKPQMYKLIIGLTASVIVFAGLAAFAFVK